MNTDRESKAYNRLCTEFYDITKPQAGFKELGYYSNFLEGVKGPILEAMCGSGRLLIPLLKKGFRIDGVDCSDHMLESCAHRCKAEKLQVNLFNQTLQNLSLSTKYAAIYIAVGSFQLIADRAEALETLRKLHEHLLPGGALVLDTFIPWGSVKDCIEGTVLLSAPRTVSFERKVTCADGSEIVMTGMTKVHPQEQLEVSESRYEKWRDGKVIAAEEEQLSVRWYYRYEMELFLEKAGFSAVCVTEESFELDPQLTVYVATK